MNRSASRRGLRPILVLATLALVAGMLAVLMPAAGAAPNQTKCQAEDLTTGTKSSPNLQALIDAAGPGDTIQVKGICVGNFSISKDLTLKGKATNYVPQATLDGGYVAGSTISPGAVLTITQPGIPRPTVAISNLLIQHGADLANDVGGISSLGVILTLSNSTVSDNTGAGIVNSGGSLTLIGSSVTRNVAAFDGGGISSRSNVTLTNSTVSQNTAMASCCIDLTGGGGVAVESFDEFRTFTLTLNGSSTITGNRTNNYGGGVFLFQTNVVMNDTSSITGNHADNNDDGIGEGGGIFHSCGTSLTGPATGNVTGNYRGSGTDTIDNVSSGPCA